MADSHNSTDATTASATPVRTKTKATVLKLKMGAVKRELVTLQSKIESFKAMEKAHAGIVSKHGSLTNDLVKIKADLIKEMGLD